MNKRQPIEEVINDVLTKGYSFSMVMTYNDADRKKFYEATQGYSQDEIVGDLLLHGIFDVSKVLDIIHKSK